MIGKRRDSDGETDVFRQLKYPELQVRCGPLIHDKNMSIENLVKRPSYLTNFGHERHHITQRLRTEVLFDVEQESENQDEIYLLPILHRERRRQSYGLVLNKEVKHGKGYFSRIGVFDTGGYVAGDVKFWKVGSEGSKYQDVVADDSCYEQILGPDEEGNLQYVIRLI
jgi:hypothetical protein